jgi:hypothetical protein
MFETNMYSTIKSKEFGVKIGDNFLFIIVERFYNSKHMVEEQRM